MRHPNVAWFVLAGLAFVTACGSGGSGTGGPRGGYTYEDQIRPVEDVGTWDPFAPSPDDIIPQTDPAGCANERTAVTLGQLYRLLQPRVCELALKCGDIVSTEPTPDQPEYVQTPAPGGTTTQETAPPLPTTLISAQCIEVLGNLDFEFGIGGEAGFGRACYTLTRAIRTFDSYPSCDIRFRFEQSVCLDNVTRCFNDLTALGCNLNNTIPGSCRGIRFEGVGEQIACQLCIVACGGDRNCTALCQQGACGDEPVVQPPNQ